MQLGKNRKFTIKDEKNKTYHFNFTTTDEKSSYERSYISGHSY